MTASVTFHPISAKWSLEMYEVTQQLYAHYGTHLTPERGIDAAPLSEQASE